MRFETLLKLAGKLPFFHSAILTESSNPRDVRLQLSRWTKSGKIIKVWRQIYCLAAPYRKKEPHPFALSHRLKPFSYVSLESALSWHGLMREQAKITCVTVERPAVISTPFGVFHFRHLKTEYFFGFNSTYLDNDQWALIASAEKALIDLLYLTAHSNKWGIAREMKLQNLHLLKEDELQNLSYHSRSEKLRRAVSKILLPIRAAKRSMR